ncbi:MAG: hypothetical protein HY328_02040 [Chloroflexi bacterium]|nr:hypothetical protein [Chloroflexota bacterium]
MPTLQRLFILLLALLMTLPTGTGAAAQTAPLAVASASANQVSLIASSDDETVFQVDAPAYQLETVAGIDGPCQRMAMDGYETAGASGAPHLPMRSLLLGIPPGATPSLEIVADSAVRLDGVYRICPAPQAVAEEGEGGLIRYVEQAVAADSAVYSQNELFPAVATRISDSGWMGRLQFVRVEIAPFQYNPSDGSLLHHPQMQVRVRHRGAIAQAASTSGADAFTQSLQGLLLNGAQAGGWATAPLAAINAASNSGWRPPSPALRLYVREEGLYAITYDELAQAGVPIASISSHSLRLYLNGQDVAVRVVDSNNADDVDGLFAPDDRLLFYGQGVDEKYTDANVYWLSYGAAGSLHMLTRSAETGNEPVTSYRATTRYEENFNYVSSAPKLPGYNHWYGRLLTVAGGNAANSWQIPLSTSFLASGGYTATVEAAMVSRTNGSHHVKFYVNENYVGDGQWSGAVYRTFSVAFDQALLKTGSNTFRAEIANDLNGQTISVVYLDWLQLHYSRQTNAVGDRLIFDSPGPGAWNFSVDGFSAGELEAYDVTDPLRVARISLPAGATAQFGATATKTSRFLVQRTTQRKRVASIEQANTANLLATSNRTDYFIIAHKEFLAAIQPLADYRAARGLKVAVIDVQHIYDTFNYGRMSPQAIRDFLIYAYGNWQTSGSSYVLLVGDGTFDPRNFRSDSARTFIPPYLEMVDPDLGETAADNRYVTIVGTDRMPDMHLGRLPAESASDVTAMVNKILDYESAPADSGWNRNVLFVADDLKGGGGAFYNFSNAIADGSMRTDDQTVPLLPSAYQKSKLYLPYDCANGEQCRESIVSRINQGALIVSYVGHSAKEYWAEENLLNLSALNQMNNTVYPMMLPMTCLEGYYHEAEQGRMSLGEALVRKARGGAIASWSSTGLGLASGHDYLERGFFVAVFHVGVRELGPATTFGKIHLYSESPAGKYDDLLDTFTLLGDPALKLRTLDSTPEEREYGLFLPTVTR